MQRFKYMAYNGQGKRVSGQLDAVDLKDARKKLASEGLFPKKISPLSTKRRKGLQSRSLRAEFFQELAALLNAGISMDQAFTVFDDHHAVGHCARYASLKQKVLTGSSFSQALQEAIPDLRAYEEALIEVGERTGALSRSLTFVADFLEEEIRIKEETQQALSYPIMVLGLAVVVSILLFGFFMPKIQELLGNLNVPLPLLTRSFLNIGTFFQHYAVVFLGLLVLGIYLLKKRGIMQELSQFGLRLPLIRPCLESLYTLRFSRSLVMLLEGGVDLPDALLLSAKASGSHKIMLGINENQVRIESGTPLAVVLRDIPLLNQSLAGWVSAGESSGNLSNLLTVAGDRLQMQWERNIKRAVGLMEPLTIIGVGIFVLFTALAILLPIMSVKNMIGS